jgi:hypothetical protein
MAPYIPVSSSILAALGSFHYTQCHWNGSGVAYSDIMRSVEPVKELTRLIYLSVIWFFALRNMGLPSLSNPSRTCASFHSWSTPDTSSSRPIRPLSTHCIAAMEVMNLVIDAIQNMLSKFNDFFVLGSSEAGPYTPEYLSVPCSEPLWVNSTAPYSESTLTVSVDGHHDRIRDGPRPRVRPRCRFQDIVDGRHSEECDV